jgi:hypothetical protein
MKTGQTNFHRAMSLFGAGLCALAVSLMAACKSGPDSRDTTTMTPGENGGLGNRDESDLASKVGAYTSHTNRSSGSDTHPEVHTSFTGSWLYFSTDREGAGYDIFRKPLSDGPAMEKITSAKGDELWPRVSPAGRYLAFGSNAGGNWDIYVMDLFHRDQAPVRLTHSASHDIQPTWSPDGRRLVYASESSTEGGYILNYIELELAGEGGLNDNGESVSLPVVPMLIGSGGLAELPGGTKPEGDAPKGGRNLIRVKSRGQLLTAEGAQVTGMSPDFRPGNENRLQLVYQDSPVSGNQWNTLKTFDLKTGVVRLVPVSEGYGAIQPRWSPSGEQIVFATVGKRTEASKDKVFPVGADGFAVTTPDGQSVRDLDNPTIGNKVTSPLWARTTDGESRLFFSTMTGDGKAEYIASVLLKDR